MPGTVAYLLQIVAKNIVDVLRLRTADADFATN
jgi:hypothetical protein